MILVVHKALLRAATEFMTAISKEPCLRAQNKRAGRENRQIAAHASNAKSPTNTSATPMISTKKCTLKRLKYDLPLFRRTRK